MLLYKHIQAHSVDYWVSLNIFVFKIYWHHMHNDIIELHRTVWLCKILDSIGFTLLSVDYIIHGEIRKKSIDVATTSEIRNKFWKIWRKIIVLKPIKSLALISLQRDWQVWLKVKILQKSRTKSTLVNQLDSRPHDCNFLINPSNSQIDINGATITSIATLCYRIVIVLCIHQLY